MRVFVRGLGHWLPARVVGNDAWPPSFRQRAEKGLGDRTLLEIPRDEASDAGRLAARYLRAEAADPFIGARERRWAEPQDTARHAEAEAGRRACEDAGVEPREIDVVLSAEMAPDRIGPSAGCHVAHALGAERAMAIGTDAGCAAGLAQWRLASALVASGQARHVLCCQSHLMTRIMGVEHPASPGLGDAATAQVVSSQGPWRIVRQHAVTHGEFYEAITWTRGLSEEVDVPWWQAGGEYHIGTRNLRKAHALMKQSVQFGVQTLKELFAGAEIERSAVRALYSVQPRRWIPEAIATCAGLGEGAAHSTYAQFAHVGGCGPFLNWQHAPASRAPEKGELIAFYAQGAGFTRAAALLEREDGRARNLR